MSLTDPFASPLTVTTDYSDYAPGSTAIFTAANLEIGGTVEFSVAHVTAGPDGIAGTADDQLRHDLSGTTSAWRVIDGGAGDLDGVANGVIVTSWQVGQDALNQAFQMSATNVASGEQATAAFTDSTQIDLTADGASIPIGGAIFVDSQNIGSGTGNYNTFLAISVGGSTPERIRVQRRWSADRVESVHWRFQDPHCLALDRAGRCRSCQSHRLLRISRRSERKQQRKAACHIAGYFQDLCQLERRHHRQNDPGSAAARLQYGRGLAG
jgi:hypothetical protein